MLELSKICFKQAAFDSPELDMSFSVRGVGSAQITPSHYR
jgi:hypothetical protein